MSSLSAVVSIGELTINVVGLAFIALQAYQARREFTASLVAQREERKRNRRQETLHFLMDTLQHRRDQLERLPDEHDVAGMNDYASGLINQFTAEARGLVLPYLGHYEDLAVALRSDTYDLLMFDSMHGLRLLNVWNSYQEFIHWYRNDINDPAYLWNFERLATKVKLIERKWHGMIPDLTVECTWDQVNDCWADAPT